MAATGEGVKCCADVAPIMRHTVSALRGIDDPQTARKALGLSLAEMGRALGVFHPNGHKGRPYHRTSVCHFEQRDYRVTEETREAYRGVIVEAVRRATNGRWGIRARMGPRTWKVRPAALCTVCGKPFEPRRGGQKRCKRCLR